MPAARLTHAAGPTDAAPLAHAFPAAAAGAEALGEAQRTTCTPDSKSIWGLGTSGGVSAFPGAFEQCGSGSGAGAGAGAVRLTFDMLEPHTPDGDTRQRSSSTPIAIPSPSRGGKEVGSPGRDGARRDECYIGGTFGGRARLPTVSSGMDLVINPFLTNFGS